MADWGGFTEEDLRQLAYPGKIDMGSTPKKSANFGKQKNKHANRDRAFGQQKKRVTLSDVVEVMPVDQMLNPDSLSNGDAGSPTPKTNNETKVSPIKPQNTKTPPKSALKPSKPIERHISRSNSNSFGNDGKLPNAVSLNNSECCRELNEEEAHDRELNQIQKFQHQQKLIEEKNKQTKTLLAQAIKERRARAESEAHLLTDLQKELSRLDNLLTTDVSIIRDRIEMSSLEYTESLKRYEKAEKEFVESKMELFRHAEIKEKLTEHLYTIIYQNEMRKAQKLSELMEMLELTTSGEEVECILPAIPPIPMYNPVQTLYSPCKSARATKEAEITKPENTSPIVKSEACDNPKVSDQSVESNVSVESKESLSEGTLSSPSPEEDKKEHNNPNVTCDVISSLHNSLPTQMSEEKCSVDDPSVESVKLTESEESQKDKEDGVNDASSSDCNVSDSNTVADPEKISSPSQTNSKKERTNKDKKATLKELAQ